MGAPRVFKCSNEAESGGPAPRDLAARPHLFGGALQETGGGSKFHGASTSVPGVFEDEAAQRFASYLSPAMNPQRHAAGKRQPSPVLYLGFSHQPR